MLCLIRVALLMVFLYNNRTVKPCRKGFDKIQQQLMIKTLERKKVYWDISQHEKGNIQEVHRLYENNNPTKQEFPQTQPLPGTSPLQHLQVRGTCLCVRRFPHINFKNKKYYPNIVSRTNDNIKPQAERFTYTPHN